MTIIKNDYYRLTLSKHSFYDLIIKTTQITQVPVQYIIMFYRMLQNGILKVLLL